MKKFNIGDKVKVKDIHEDNELDIDFPSYLSGKVGFIDNIEEENGEYLYKLDISDEYLFDDEIELYEEDEIVGISVTCYMLLPQDMLLREDVEDILEEFERELAMFIDERYHDFKFIGGTGRYIKVDKRGKYYK